MTKVVIAGLIITIDACGQSGCITGPAFVLPENAFILQNIHKDLPSSLDD